MWQRPVDFDTVLMFDWVVEGSDFAEDTDWVAIKIDLGKISQETRSLDSVFNSCSCGHFQGYKCLLAARRVSYFNNQKGL